MYVLCDTKTPDPEGLRQSVSIVDIDFSDSTASYKMTVSHQLVTSQRCCEYTRIGVSVALSYCGDKHP